MSKERLVQDQLNDILESIADIKEFTQGMVFEDFIVDKKTKAAVIRNMEIVGEAVGKLPEHIRSRYPKIPWGDICGIRNKIAHEYFGVDLSVVWQTIEDDLEPLAKTVSQILIDLGEDGRLPPTEDSVMRS